MQFPGGPAREQRPREMAVGASFAPSATQREVHYQGRRVTLFISSSVHQELNRLVLDRVSKDQFMRALDIVAIYESNVRDNIDVTTQTIDHLETVITAQVERGQRRSQVMDNIIRFPERYLIAPRQERAEFPDRPAREGFRRDPFHPSGRGDGRGERRHMG